MSHQKVHEQCYEGVTSLANVRRCIREGHPVLVLMRGIPGSGKSTLANELAELDEGGVVRGTDHMMMVNGKYKFQPERLDEFHKKNQAIVRDDMHKGVKPIIVDNTNVAGHHMKPYVNHAITNQYEVYMVEPETAWAKKVGECTRRNTHNVSKDAIERMLDSFERVSLQQLIKPNVLKIVPPILCDDDDDYLVASKPVTAAAAAFSMGVPHTPNGAASVFQTPPPSAPHSTHWNSAAPVFVPMQQPSTHPPTQSPFISMVPRPAAHTTSVQVCDVGAQTSDVIGMLSTCGADSRSMPSVVQAEAEKTIHRPNVVVEKKERPSNTEYTGLPSEMDVLLTAFPLESTSEMWTWVEQLGCEATARLYLEANAFVDLDTHVVEDSFSRLVAECDISDTVRNSMDVSGGDRLEEATAMHTMRIGEEPDNEQERESGDMVLSDRCVEVLLSDDIKNKLTVMFGDEQQSVCGSLALVPAWLLHQLYLAWQGVPVEYARAAQYDASFPDTRNDEEIARMEQERLNEEQLRRDGKVALTRAQRHQLDGIVGDYKNIGSEVIEEVFRDCNCDSTITRMTLGYMLGEEARLPPTPTIEAVAASERKEREERSRLITVGGRGTVEEDRTPRSAAREKNLSSAQHRAKQLQAEADVLEERAQIEYTNAASHARNRNMQAAGIVYSQKARGLQHQAAAKREEAARLIMEANRGQPCLDLHLLPSKHAIALLKERLECIDRPPNLRNGSSGRVLRVITGRGKNSQGKAVLKPAVEAYLKQKGYRYIWVNVGEVQVTAM